MQIEKSIYKPEEHLKPYRFKPGVEHLYWGKKRLEHSKCMKDKGLTGSKNPYWKGGISKKELTFCKWCNKKIYRIIKRTNFCSQDCQGKWQAKNLTGEKACNWQGKITEVECFVCKKKYFKKQCLIKKHNLCSKQCNQLFHKEKSKEMWNNGIFSSRYSEGCNNPNWKGGISREPYSFDFNNELKELVRKRDNYKCQECGAPQEEFNSKLPVHHIDGNKTNSNPDNLITLCVYCHNKKSTQQKGVYKNEQICGTNNYN